MLRQVFRVTLKEGEIRDMQGHSLVQLASTREDLQEANAPLQLNVEVLEGAITEAASKAPGGKPFEYLLSCFKRISRGIRSTKYTGPEDPKHGIFAETRRLCMSYCVFAVTMPEMFGENVPTGNPLVNHMLNEPESETGICYDFLSEASSRFEEDESIKEAVVGAVEDLSQQLSQKAMLGDERAFVNGLRNFIRFPKIVQAIVDSPKFLPEGLEPQDIETKSLLGPFYRLSPMQQEVASNYFSAPKTRDRGFISNAQQAVRMTLRTHQQDLFQIADTIIRAGAGPRGRMLDWFALCVNKNHKKRAMRVDYRTVSSDGFMVNVTNTLDQLCEPFMDARFGKIEKIDINYLRRTPRVDISDETKINADQKAADAFYEQKVDGTSNFISEVFFLTVAAHHYGTEAAQTRMQTSAKTVKRMEKDLEAFEAERHKYINVRLPHACSALRKSANRVIRTHDTCLASTNTSRRSRSPSTILGRPFMLPPVSSSTTSIKLDQCNLCAMSSSGCCGWLHSRTSHRSKYGCHYRQSKQNSSRCSQSTCWRTSWRTSSSLHSTFRISSHHSSAKRSCSSA